MTLTDRQAKALRQTLRAEMRVAGTGFPMPMDLFKQLERKGLVVAGEHTYERQAFGKVVASRIPVAFLTPFGKKIAETELIKATHQALTDKKASQ